MMNNNPYNLEEKSTYRQDIKGIIKYTLFLDYILPESYEIDDIKKNVKRCCRPLLNARKVSEEEEKEDSFRLDFFGDVYDDNNENNPNNILSLNFYPYSRDGEKKNRSKGFVEMLINDALFSCYHALAMDYFSDLAITDYTICNKIKDSGICKLRDNGEIKKKGDGTLYIPNEKRGIGKRNKSSDASSFNLHLKTREKILRGFFGKLSDRDGGKYSLPMSNILYGISYIEIPDLNRLYNLDRIYKTDEIIESICTIIGKTRKGFKGDHDDPQIDSSYKMDVMYRYYLMERIFGVNLLQSLYFQGKELRSEAVSYNLFDLSSLDAIMSSYKLPCVFSRPYLMEYAFDTILKANSYRDFWEIRSLGNRNRNDKSMLTFTRSIYAGFHFPKWIEQVQLYINLISDYIYPLITWCMISMLLDTIEAQHPQENHQEHLLIGMQEIEKHVDSHYKEILKPIAVPIKQSDAVDVYRKVKAENYYKSESKDALTEKEWKNIFKSFYSNTNVPLNVAPLDTTLFIKARNNNIDNFKDIQDFYLDIVRDNKLQPNTMKASFTNRIKAMTPEEFIDTM